MTEVIRATSGSGYTDLYASPRKVAKLRLEFGQTCLACLRKRVDDADLDFLR